MSTQIKHSYLKSTEIIFQFGKVTLDAEGAAEISDEQAKLIEGHPDFEIKQVKAKKDKEPESKKVEEDKKPSPEEEFRNVVAGYDRTQLIEAALQVNPGIKKNLTNAEYVEIIVAAKFPKE